MILQNILSDYIIEEFYCKGIIALLQWSRIIVHKNESINTVDTSCKRVATVNTSYTKAI